MSSERGVLSLISLLLLFNFCHRAYGRACASHTIRCAVTSNCVYTGHICDGDNDCGDNSDENSCQVWRKHMTDCPSKAQASCQRNGKRTCISLTKYCSESNPPCSGNLDPRVCQVILSGILRPIDDVNLQPIVTEDPTLLSPPMNSSTLQESERGGQMFLDAFNQTLSHPDCPKFYTRVGDQCLSFFYVAKVGWGEAKEICVSIDGELISFPGGPDDLISFMKHIRDSGLMSDFWIGGRYVNDRERWRWLKGDAMQMGTPYWAVRYSDVCLKREGRPGAGVPTNSWSTSRTCFHYQQAPRGPKTTDDACAAITFKHYYLITDENCLARKSPLCIHKKRN